MIKTQRFQTQVECRNGKPIHAQNPCPISPLLSRSLRKAQEKASRLSRGLFPQATGTGLKSIQVCSFVSPKRVPGWADADEVVRLFKPHSDIRYSALWFNKKGIDRALQFADKLTLSGTIHTVASEAFSKSNLNRSRDDNLLAMTQQTIAHQAASIEVNKLSVMAAFGCNFAGYVDMKATLCAIDDGMLIASDNNANVQEIALADTMGWANPGQIQRVVHTVREAWPDIALRLHLHDTRGLGIANAYAALQCGVSRFDTTIGGLGGCPFAACQPSAQRTSKRQLPPGNIATEELVLLAMELGIATGVDLDALIDVGHLAENIVGHPLPSAALRGGSLSRYRQAIH